MTSYLLRVAATNFDNFIGDTEMLPAIRGGSLILDRGIALAKTAAELEAVSQGGSVGLFTFNAENDDEARTVLAAVKAKLASPPDDLQALRHATFVADVVPMKVKTGDKFARSIEQSVAANRWRQMQAPSLAMPSPIARGAEACRKNHLRPANGDHVLDGHRLCPSVHQRKLYGNKAKQMFYKQTFGFDYGPGYSNSFADLTRDPSRGNLNGKMAVIYLDGNGFGALQNGLQNAEAHQQFDASLQQVRQEALGHLLESARSTPGMLERDDGPLRIEILLWGGDDIVLVVPGWAGPWALATLFSTAESWKFKRKKKKKKKVVHPLTFGGGMVLCHHNAPIHRIRRLAEELASWAKRDWPRGKRKPSENLVAYEVLESFDDVGDDLDDYREARTPAGFRTEDLALVPTALGPAMAAYAVLEPVLPKRQVRAAAQAAIVDDPDKLIAAVRQIHGSLRTEEVTALADLLTNLGGLVTEAGPPRTIRTKIENEGGRINISVAEQLGWVHLGRLGDYLLPLEQDLPNGEASDA